MNYMLCRHKVKDYAKWREVFDADAKPREETGFHLLHLLRDVSDPNYIVMLFELDDVEKAKAFCESPSAHEAAAESGVIGEPEAFYLTD
ncbi:MAG: cyclase [Phycisphaerae bacterium]|jgi:quinol monooxygenase YgiN